MPDYSKTLIYKICCNDTSIKDIYVGSTCNFTQRKWLHKTHCINKTNRQDKHSINRLYNFIRENGGWDNWTMIMIEEVNCKDKREKEKVEREYYDKLKPTLNSQLPFYTREEKKKWHKNHYQKNREERLNQEKLRYENNKEEIKRKRREYYHKNKERINEQRRKKYQESKNLKN
jgi:hypothetical protein